MPQPLQNPQLSDIPKRASRKLRRIISHSLEDARRLISNQLKPAPVINQKELRIIGLRRTGNHAVAEWIKAQQSGKLEQLNNLDANRNPYRHKYEKLMDFYPEHHRWAEKHYRPLAQGQFVDLDYLLCGYEDQSLTDICTDRYETLHDIYVGKSHKRFDILILRDPFNLFASRIKSKMIDVKSRRFTVADLWLQHAREFLGETHYLTQSRVCISYNQWVSDKQYRAAIAKQLGLEFTDAGIDRVVSLGGGSSFEGQSMDGKGSQMAVLDRWQVFRNDPEYRQIFKNQSLIEYSERIFGKISGTEELLV